MILNKRILFGDLPHSRRIELQQKLFGKGHTPAENERFYRFVWDNKPHICEECFRPLNNYSATYVSHILTRGANPEIAHDPRNVNILCPSCHGRWENGDREGMRVYRKNRQIIEKLKQEYYADK